MTAEGEQIPKAHGLGFRVQSLGFRVSSSEAGSKKGLRAFEGGLKNYQHRG